MSIYISNVDIIMQIILHNITDSLSQLSFFNHAFLQFQSHISSFTSNISSFLIHFFGFHKIFCLHHPICFATFIIISLFCIALFVIRNVFKQFYFFSSISIIRKIYGINKAFFCDQSCLAFCIQGGLLLLLPLGNPCNQLAAKSI